VSGRVVVVGAGVSGLAAALRVHELAPERDLVVLEATGRIGGALLTERADGLVVEGGAESFLTEKPWGVALADRIGIGDQLVSPAEGERCTYVVRAGRLLPMPAGFLLLAPTRAWPVLTSSIFSTAGKIRLGLDLVLPRRRDDRDESLAAFTRRRFGREALERVVDPLIGGIYTADPERLSVHATLPRFPALERSHRSVIRGLRATTARPARAAAGARYGLFVTHREGMGAFAAAIAARLPPGAVRLATGARRLERLAEGWRVHTAAGEALDAAAVIVATPAHHAASLVRDVDERLAAALEEIEYASSATVTLVYARRDLRAPLPGFGFVVPHRERRDLIAATFLSRKYPFRWPDVEVVRAFVGGARRPEMAALPEADLVRRVRADLTALAGIEAEPRLVRVHRWERAMPQYVVGHVARVEAIAARAARLPGLALAGAAYRGVGIPDCIRSGEAAATAVVSGRREPA
jgi:oxygen-dependent protoporphyrinogen oxidase